MSTGQRSDLRGRTVLVVGGRGFIGTNVCRQLAAAGALVHAASRSAEAGSDAIRCWPADCGDAEIVRSLVSAVRPEIIVHLAGFVQATRDVAAVLPTAHSDFMTVVNVLTVATERRVPRTIIIGSMEEPTAGDTQDAAVGAAEPVPSSPYAAAKWAAVGYARMFHKLYDTPVVVLRPFMTYGPGDERPQKLIPYVINSLLEQKAPLLSSGRHLIDWIYVDDVAAGIVAAATMPDVEGATLDIGSGVLISIHDLVGHIVRLLGTDIVPRFGALPDRPSERVSRANTAVAEARLNWRPQVGLEDGLARTIAWHRQRFRAPRT